MKDDVVSSTALTVLQGIVYISKYTQFNFLVSQEMEDASLSILTSSQEGRKRLRQLENRFSRSLIPLVEKILMPKITLHYALRKKYIEDYTREAITNGFTQIVNLGAGFDTLGYRLSNEFSNISFIEIDHPATQLYKREVLKDSRENLHLLSVDFAKESLEERLKSFENFSSTKDTLFISEGVLMYLNEKSVRDLFQSLDRLTESRMEFLFTFTEPPSDTKNSYGVLLKLYLKFKSENLLWYLKRGGISGFLNSLNVNQKEFADAEIFREKYLSGRDIKLHDGESIIVIEKRD